MKDQIKLISTKELAVILGKSESTARELMMSKDFPSMMIKHRYYVLESRLYNWLLMQESKN